MAVPVGPYNDETSAVIYPAPVHTMVAISELSSTQAEEVYTVQKESPVDNANLSSSDHYQNKTSHTFSTMSSQCKKSIGNDNYQPNTGLKKYLNNLFERKKSKLIKKFKNPFSKEGKKKGLKYFLCKIKCLRVEKTCQEIKNFEDTAVPDERECYGRSVLSTEKSTMFTPDHIIVPPVENEDVRTRQYRVGEEKIKSYGGSQFLTHEEDNPRKVHFFSDNYSADMDYSLPQDSQWLPYKHDSFRDVHHYSPDMDLSSLLGQPMERDRLYEGVSKTVEADGVGSEMTDVEDDKCQETMVKEVATCKQSASILPKADTLKHISPSTSHEPIIQQCTEAPGEYVYTSTVREPDTKAEKASQESGISKINHDKDECIDFNPGRPVLMKPSHTQPVLDDSVEPLDPSEFSNDDDFKDKLEYHTMKPEVEQYHQCTTPFNNTNLDKFVFQKEKCKSNLKTVTGPLPVSPHLFSVKSSGCSCSRTVSYCLSVEGPKMSPFSCTNPEKCPPQRDPLSVSLDFLWIFFIYGLVSCWFDLKRRGKLYEECCKKIAAMLQNHTDKKAEGKNDEQKKLEKDAKQKENTETQLMNDQGVLCSSDVVESLQSWLSATHTPVVNSEQYLNQSNPAKHTENSNIHQHHPAVSSGNLSVDQPKTRKSLSDQVSSLQRKRKLAPRWKKGQRYRCYKHTVKPALPKDPLHHSKSRTSRRLVKRLNSLEQFVFQQSTDRNSKANKCDTGRLNYLHIMPDMRSQVNVFMLPFNHPNSHSTAAAVNGTSGTDHEQENSNEILGATARRLGDMERPSTFNEQITVFEQINAGSVTESMKYEWARFKSFWSFPMSCPISPTMLAKYGFYYTGNEDKVCCFCCGVVHGGWQKGQSVYAMHYQVSRRCRYMKGENVGNVPIHGPFSSLSRRGGGAALQPTAEEEACMSMLQTPDSITSILIGREQDAGNPTATTSLAQALPTATALPAQALPTATASLAQALPTVTALPAQALPTATALPAQALPTATASLAQALPTVTALPAQALPTVPSVRTEMRNGLGAGGASSPSTSQTSGSSSPSVSQAPSPQPVPPVATPNPTPAVTQTGHGSAHQQISAGPNTSTVSQTTSNVVTRTASQAHSDTVANQQRPANQQQPTTLAQRHHQRDQEQQQQQGQQQPLGRGNGSANNPANLGVTTAKPRYPNYAVLTVRSSTFHGFPNHLDQTPLQMARAGFFYAGYGDYVRCFFCGGGLRNWEAGDDPWVEHARWFPRCSYVKQNKGQTFINLVLQRQRELTLPNEYINTTTGASLTSPSATNQSARTTDTQTVRTTDSQTSTGGTPPPATSSNTTPNPSSRQPGLTDTQRPSQTQTTVTDEEMNSPAVLSIKEMGYSDEVIKTAIQYIRRNRGPIPISAELLVETIFGLADDNLPTQRLDQTGTSNIPATAQTETANTSLPNTPPSENRTPESQAGAASTQPDPRPPRRIRDGDSSTRAYSEEELKSIKEENNQLKEQMKCKICMDNVVCISFLPCGHLCCCAECAPAMVKCPICRQIIRGSVKTYLS